MCNKAIHMAENKAVPGLTIIYAQYQISVIK